MNFELDLEGAGRRVDGGRRDSYQSGSITLIRVSHLGRGTCDDDFVRPRANAQRRPRPNHPSGRCTHDSGVESPFMAGTHEAWPGAISVHATTRGAARASEPSAVGVRSGRCQPLRAQPGPQNLGAGRIVRQVDRLEWHAEWQGGEWPS